jgi:hypothetical protein
MSKINLNGEWKNLSIPYVKIGEDWRKIALAYVNINGVWKRTTFGSPPPVPVVSYSSTSKFKITNYDSTLYYEVTGSGSITGDTVTVNVENGTAQLTVSYIQGSPKTPPATMERKKYTYTNYPYYVQQSAWIDTSYAATSTTEQVQGDFTNCAPYEGNCNGFIAGPQDDNTCLCIGSRPFNAYALGGGLCPGSPWYVCNGNRCCYDKTTYSCPNGGTLSGTTCLSGYSIDTSYWADNFVKDATPTGYLDGGSEWYKIY